MDIFIKNKFWWLIKCTKKVLDKFGFIETLTNIPSIFTNHLIYYPTPKNLNYIWSFGSLAGIFLAVHYLTNVVFFLLGNDRLIGIGDTVEKTDQIVSIPVGTDDYLGRIVDSLGNFIDGLGSVEFPARALIDTKVPGMNAKEKGLTNTGYKKTRITLTGKRYLHSSSELKDDLDKDFFIIYSDSGFDKYIEEKLFTVNFCDLLVGFKSDLFFICSDSSLDVDEGHEVFLQAKLNTCKDFILIDENKRDQIAPVCFVQRIKNFFERFTFIVKDKLELVLFSNEGWFNVIFVFILNIALIYVLSPFVCCKLSFDRHTVIYSDVLIFLCINFFFCIVLKYFFIRYKIRIICFSDMFGVLGSIFFYIIFYILLSINSLLFIFLLKASISLFFFHTADGQILVKNLFFFLTRRYSDKEKIIDLSFFFF